MKATIYPSISKGNVIVPSSKSILHRYIICACLAKGVSTISNFTVSDDIYATINAFLPFGVKYTIDKDTIKIDSRNFKRIDSCSVDVKESASSLRFLIPVLSNFADKVTFKGSKSLLSRPLDEYKKVFGDSLQILDDCVTITKKVEGNTFYIDASVTSQYITGLVYALSLKDYPSTIILQGKIASPSYIRLTIDALNLFGASVKWDDDVIYVLPSEYKPLDISVEGDYTQGSNFIVLSRINSKVSIEGLNPNSHQGDKAIYELLEQEEIDLDNNIDLGPILLAYASTLPKITKFTGTNRLVYKESNRLLSMKEELAKFGVDVDIYDDVCFVHGKKELIASSILSTHNDHRICMALAILSTIAKKQVTIDNIEVVNKSYPNFFNDLAKLGIKIQIL